MSQSKKDVVELITKNVGLIKKKFGGEFTTDMKVYIDFEKSPNITPQCIFTQTNANTISNDKTKLSLDDLDIIKKVLLHRTKNQDGQYVDRLSKDTGKYNVIIFEKSKSQEPNIQYKQNLEIQKLRSQSLFLLDQHANQLKNNSQLLSNILEHICSCAYDFSSQNQDDKDQLCKLYVALKHGKDIGAIQTLTTNFLSDPKQTIQFLQKVNTNLDPNISYSGENWLQTSPVGLDKIVQKLKQITQNYRQQKLDELQKYVKNQSNTEELENALVKTFNISPNYIRSGYGIKQRLTGLGQYNDNMSEILNAFIIMNLPDFQPDYSQRIDLFQNYQLDKDNLMGLFM